SSAAHSTASSLTVTVPADCSISVSPYTALFRSGQSVTSTVSTTVTSGNAQTMTLSASGLPAGATASFNPSTVTAGGSSTLTIGTSAANTAGRHTRTETDTGPQATQSTSVAITVT